MHIAWQPDRLKFHDIYWKPREARPREHVRIDTEKPHSSTLDQVTSIGASEDQLAGGNFPATRQLCLRGTVGTPPWKARSRPRVRRKRQQMEQVRADLSGHRTLTLCQASNAQEEDNEEQ